MIQALDGYDGLKVYGTPSQGLSFGSKEAGLLYEGDPKELPFLKRAKSESYERPVANLELPEAVEIPDSQTEPDDLEQRLDRLFEAPAPAKVDLGWSASADLSPKELYELSRSREASDLGGDFRSLVLDFRDKLYDLAAMHVSEANYEFMSKALEDPKVVGMDDQRIFELAKHVVANLDQHGAQLKAEIAKNAGGRAFSSRDAKVATGQAMKRLKKNARDTANAKAAQDQRTLATNKKKLTAFKPSFDFIQTMLRELFDNSMTDEVFNEKIYSQLFSKNLLGSIVIGHYRDGREALSEEGLAWKSKTAKQATKQEAFLKRRYEYISDFVQNLKKLVADPEVFGSETERQGKEKEIKDAQERITAFAESLQRSLLIVN